jgi:hypothetical protein
MKTTILQALTGLTATGMITFVVTHMHMTDFYVQWSLWFLHWLVAWPIAFATMRWISPLYRWMLEQTESTEIEYRYYADELKDVSGAEEIKTRYHSRYPQPIPNPNSHPWLFDPFVPPLGWRYDPHYEIWVKDHEKNN